MKKKPNVDNQVLTLSQKWRESPTCDLSNAANIFTPKKLLALPGGGLVALMFGVVEQSDAWMVFSLDAKGVPARSTIYQSRSFGESAWTALCDELTSANKISLASVALDTSLPGETRADAALEMCRLDRADDEKTEANTTRAREFVETHTTEEVEAYITSELAAYRERRASGGKGEA